MPHFYFRPPIFKSIAVFVLSVFIQTSVFPVPLSLAAEPLVLPKPGVMVSLSPEFTPAHLKGLTIHPEDALQFDFIIHKGGTNLSEGQKQEEYKKLIKYFLASLAVPDENQWVNLSPYEKDRIIKDDFGKTEMGRDLLSQDYLLKQITASLIYPEQGLGQKFWDRVYERIRMEHPDAPSGGRDPDFLNNIPVNVGTFNKVWIVPDDAVIYEKGNTAYVLKNHLKVLLEADYLAMQKANASKSISRPQAERSSQDIAQKIGTDIVRQIVLPALEKEVNEGKNFAQLRQVYSGMILAAWYKRALKESLLSKIYANKSKLKGVEYANSITTQRQPAPPFGGASTLPTPQGLTMKATQSNSPNDVEVIYQQYLQAFKKGVYNYIKEDTDKYTHQTIPRKYFSGGTEGYGRDFAQIVKQTSSIDFAQAADIQAATPNLDSAAVALRESDKAMFDVKDIVRSLLEKPVVLLVEDNKVFAESSIQTLREMQIEVVWVANKAAAVDMMTKRGAEFGLVWSDDSMPEEAGGSEERNVGFNLIQEIRRDHPDLPIVFYPSLLPALPHDMQRVVSFEKWRVSGFLDDLRAAMTTAKAAKQNRKLWWIDKTDENSTPVGFRLGRFMRRPLGEGLFPYGLDRKRSTADDEDVFAFLGSIGPEFGIDGPFMTRMRGLSQRERMREIIDKLQPLLEKADGFGDVGKTWLFNFLLFHIIDDTDWRIRTTSVPAAEAIKKIRLALGFDPSIFKSWLERMSRGGYVDGNSYTFVVGENMGEERFVTELVHRERGQRSATHYDDPDGLPSYHTEDYSYGVYRVTVNPQMISGPEDLVDYFPHLPLSPSQRFLLIEQIRGGIERLKAFSEEVCGVLNQWFKGHPFVFAPEKRMVWAPGDSTIEETMSWPKGGERLILSFIPASDWNLEPTNLGRNPTPFPLTRFRGDGAESTEKVRIPLSAFRSLNALGEFLSLEVDVHLSGPPRSENYMIERIPQLRAFLEQQFPEFPNFTDTAAAVSTKAAKPTGPDAAMRTSDKAAVAGAKTPLGGIDMNAANLHMQIRRDGKGVPLPIAQQDLEHIDLDGLVPVILKITPAMASPLLSELQVPGAQQAKI